MTQLKMSKETCIIREAKVKENANTLPHWDDYASTRMIHQLGKITSVRFSCSHWAGIPIWTDQNSCWSYLESWLTFIDKPVVVSEED